MIFDVSIGHHGTNSVNPRTVSIIGIQLNLLDMIPVKLDKLLIKRKICLENFVKKIVEIFVSEINS